MKMHTNNDLGMNAFGKAVARRLDEGTQDLPREISERLRAARSQAVARRRKLSPLIGVAASTSGSEATMPWGPEDGGLLGRLGALLPLALLIIGLLSIGVLQDDIRADELAEIDAEILTDVLPPDAYTDPGFAHFLRSNQSQ